MKKDVEWLKKEVWKQDIVMDKGYIYTDDLMSIINEVDEPEVLSQEWIDEHTEYYEYLGYAVVPTDKLQNLIVPKQGELETKIQELIESYKQEDGAYSNPENGWISGFVEDLQNLLIPKQELPVIPDYVADWITRYSEKYDLYPALRLLENNRFVWGLIYEWYRMNTRKFVNAYLTGDYKVEEVQKYVIKLPMSTNRDMDFALVDDKGDIWVDAYPSKYKLTEQEILSLPKGDVYFKYFSEPVEERE